MIIIKFKEKAPWTLPPATKNSSGIPPGMLLFFNDSSVYNLSHKPVNLKFLKLY